MPPLMPKTKLVLLLILSLLLIACQEEAQPLIKIGERQISLSDFRLKVNHLETELTQLPAQDQKLLLRQTLSQLIDQELLLTEATQRKIVISKQELQRAIDDLRGTYTLSEYQELLRISGQQPEHWKQQLRLRLLGQKVASRVTAGKTRVDLQRVEEYYLQHLEDYRRPEQLQIQQMLFNSEEEAINIRNRLLAGEDFAKLALRHSLSPDRDNQGNLGLFARGQFPPEVDKILFSLAPGRISQPVKSPYGIHLFLVNQHLKAGLLELSEVEDSIRHQLETSEETHFYQQWLSELRDKTDIQIDWEQLDKLHFDKAE